MQHLDASSLHTGASPVAFWRCNCSLPPKTVSNVSWKTKSAATQALTPYSQALRYEDGGISNGSAALPILLPVRLLQNALCRLVPSDGAFETGAVRAREDPAAAHVPFTPFADVPGAREPQREAFRPLATFPPKPQTSPASVGPAEGPCTMFLGVFPFSFVSARNRK